MLAHALAMRFDSMGETAMLLGDRQLDGSKAKLAEPDWQAEPSRWLDDSAADMDHVLLDASAPPKDREDAWLLHARCLLIVMGDDPDAMSALFSRVKTLSKLGYKRTIAVLMDGIESKTDAVDLYRRFNRACSRFADRRLVFLGRGVAPAQLTQYCHKLATLAADPALHRIVEALQRFLAGPASPAEVLQASQPSKPLGPSQLAWLARFEDYLEKPECDQHTYLAFMEVLQQKHIQRFGQPLSDSLARFEQSLSEALVELHHLVPQLETRLGQAEAILGCSVMSDPEDST